MSIRDFEVLGTPLKEIEIGITGTREIAQNVKTIIATWRGEVFLDRQFGVDSQIIDLPLHLAQANLATDLTQQIQRYEPRAEVTGIEFQNSDAGDGRLVPLVKLRVKDGVLL
jgi:phage baseplate assembly protein W